MTRSPFRERIFTALDRLDEPDRFVYIDRDRFVWVCPACCSPLPDYLAIHFYGARDLVDVYCSRGCAEVEIAAAIAELEQHDDPDAPRRARQLAELRARRERAIERYYGRPIRWQVIP